MEDTCNSYLWFQVETKVGNGTRACLYLLGLAYCFLGLSAITARFFRSMENIVKQTREIIYIDPYTGSMEVQRERIWNYTLADISLMAFGTSFPQISLAIIDALRNLGQRYAGGLGPGTLVGSAAFDLYPIHAVCVVVPKAGEVKKVSDLGVWFVELGWSFWAYVWLYVILQVWTPNIITFWEAGLTFIQFFLLTLHAYAQDRGWKYITLPFPREDRPENWVPVESISGNGRSEYTSLIDSGSLDLEDKNWDASVKADSKKDIECMRMTLRVWLQQFKDVFPLEDYASRKEISVMITTVKVVWKLILLPWRFIFAFVPPPEIAHGWAAFVCSLLFITWISYVLTKLTDLISCVTGINPYVVAFTALASGTSWPDLVASKIAAERQETADSAIANITCSNSANLFVGIGVPWLINTTYNMIAYREPLYVNSVGLSFSLMIFFITFVLCMAALTLRRYFFGGELGGPRIWAWITCGYLMLLWVAFVVLSCLKVSNII